MARPWDPEAAQAPEPVAGSSLLLPPPTAGLGWACSSSLVPAAPWLHPEHGAQHIMSVWDS